MERQSGQMTPEQIDTHATDLIYQASLKSKELADYARAIIAAARQQADAAGVHRDAMRDAAKLARQLSCQATLPHELLAALDGEEKAMLLTIVDTVWKKATDAVAEFIEAGARPARGALEQ